MKFGLVYKLKLNYLCLSYCLNQQFLWFQLFVCIPAVHPIKSHLILQDKKDPRGNDTLYFLSIYLSILQNTLNFPPK